MLAQCPADENSALPGVNKPKVLGPVSAQGPDPTLLTAPLKPKPMAHAPGLLHVLESGQGFGADQGERVLKFHMLGERAVVIEHVNRPVAVHSDAGVHAARRRLLGVSRRGGNGGGLRGLGLSSA